MRMYNLYSMSFILLLMLFSITIQAQDSNSAIEIRVEKRDQVDDGPIIIYSDGDTMMIDGKNAPKGEMQVESFKGDAVEVNGNKIKIKGFQKDNESGQNQGEKPSSEIRRIDKEKVISTSPNDSEKMRKAQEKMNNRRNEVEKAAGSPQEPKKVAERPGEVNRGGGPSEDGLKRYIDAVVNKNLFLPLGSGGEEKKNSYAVTALISTNTDSRKPDDKAIIQEVGSNKGYYVSEGDSFADNVKVLEIDDNEVKLNRSGEEMTLKLGEGTGGGGGRGGWSGGGGGKPSSSQPENRQEMSKKQEAASRSSGGSNFDPSQIPPFALEILKQRGISIEELQNNPDLREKLRAEFTQRFGGGGGQSDGRGSGRRNR